MNKSTKNTVIRPYTPTDLSQVIDLWVKTGLVVAQNDPAKDIARKLNVDPDLFLLGISHNRVIGTVMVGYEGHRGWINYLAVDPQQQRCGVGQMLMSAAESELAKRGCPKVNLQIRRSNKGVIEFYESMGYREDDVVSLGKRIDQDEIREDIAK